MGYSYDKSGRLCCDVCEHAGGVRKYQCPFNYCPAIALCPTCHKAHPEYTSIIFHRQHGCESASAQYRQLEARQTELFNAGKFVRCSALWHPKITVAENVKVIFHGQAGEQAYFMSQETYAAIPMLTPATIEDYQARGNVIPAKSLNIYEPV